MRLTKTHAEYLRLKMTENLPAWAVKLEKVPARGVSMIDRCVNAHAGPTVTDCELHNAIELARSVMRRRPFSKYFRQEYNFAFDYAQHRRRAVLYCRWWKKIITTTRRPQ